jgi:hypothetical protein
VQKIATPDQYYQGFEPVRSGWFRQWEKLFSGKETGKDQTSMRCSCLKNDPKQNKNHKPACQRQQAYLDSFFIENHIVIVQILFGENKLHKHNWVYKVNDKFFCGNSKNTIK